MAPQPNLFYPEMMHFALPLHATREELIELAAGWAAAHELHVSIERFFPDYLVAAVARGGDLATGDRGVRAGAADLPARDAVRRSSRPTTSSTWR